jgi:toxin YoeB
LVAWSLRFKRTAEKDAARLKAAGLKSKAEAILALIQEDPFRVPPPCEKLIGDLTGLFSRRVNRQHRIVYEVLVGSGEVVVYRMYSHYGD